MSYKHEYADESHPLYNKLSTLISMIQKDFKGVVISYVDKHNIKDENYVSLLVNSIYNANINFICDFMVNSYEKEERRNVINQYTKDVKRRCDYIMEELK